MKITIKSKIEELLSKEFYCSQDELNGKSTVYSINLNANQPYIKILAYRNCVVVCTSEDLHYKVRELLQGRSRDELFELPLVYGQTIHYVPDDNYIVRGLTRELLARNIIPFYSASITNIGSQMVASRCGYIPFWVDTFGTILDGSSVYDDMIKGLSPEFVE